MSHDDKRLSNLLRDVIPPADAQLRRDLWPGMLARMSDRSVRVPWFDWALLAAFVVACLAVPVGIPVLLYFL